MKIYELTIDGALFLCMDQKTVLHEIRQRISIADRKIPITVEVREATDDERESVGLPRRDGR